MAKSRAGNILVDWAYKEKHTYGVDRWGKLCPTCGGGRQSPIHIKTAKTEHDENLGEFGTFNTTEGVKWELVNTGHTVQVNFQYTRDKDQAVKISGGGLSSEYIVKQFHFHWGSDHTKGSEHQINGRAYPMELHIVTYKEKYKSWDNAAGRADGVAAFGVFFEVPLPGTQTASNNENPYIKNLVKHFEKIKYPGTSVEVDEPFALDCLLPDMCKYYRYKGGLTTPPCSKVPVIWTVFQDTIKVSSEQLEAFRNIKESPDHNMVDNFRPPQPLGKRRVKRSFRLHPLRPPSRHSRRVR